MKRIETGRLGEELAAQFLCNAGMEIIARNFRVRHGEIDLIAREAGVVVFVEVKTCRSSSFGPPETWITPRKQKRIGQAAAVYIHRNNLYETDCRFDVVTVYLDKAKPEIHHIVNAFWLESEEDHA